VGVPSSLSAADSTDSSILPSRVVERDDEEILSWVANAALPVADNYGWMEGTGRGRPWLGEALAQLIAQRVLHRQGQPESHGRVSSRRAP
jgi:hypothetical protein